MSEDPAEAPFFVMRVEPDKILQVRSAFLAAQSAADLADVLNRAYAAAFPEKGDPRIQAQTLTYFAFHCRERYRSFEIPKSSGGIRVIRAPRPKLKVIQRALNVCFLSVFRPHKAAYGFVPERSVVDNAFMHAGRRYVLNLDLKDFFPSTSFRRVKTVLGLEPFALSGEREPLAFLIANLCCEESDEGGAALPQGAPTSPTLTNVVCQRLDRKLHRLARQHRVRYTRYADDLSFSSDDNVFNGGLRDRIATVIREEGYRVNEKKERLQSRHIRQEVTGLTVNERPNVRRSYVKDIRYWLRTWRVFGYERAAADFLDRRGIEYSASGRTPRLEYMLDGKIAFLAMVRGRDDRMVERFRADFAELLAGRHGGETPASVVEASTSHPTRDAKVECTTDGEDAVVTELRRILDIWEQSGINAAIEYVSPRSSSSLDGKS